MCSTYLPFVFVSVKTTFFKSSALSAVIVILEPERVTVTELGFETLNCERLSSLTVAVHLPVLTSYFAGYVALAGILLLFLLVPLGTSW